MVYPKKDLKLPIPEKIGKIHPPEKSGWYISLEDEGRYNLPRPLLCISSSDIEELWKPYKELTQKDIFSIGIDIHHKAGYVSERVPHRNLRGRKVFVHRIVGFERLDEDWCDSPYSSREARRALSVHKSYMAERSKYVRS